MKNSGEIISDAVAVYDAEEDRALVYVQAKTSKTTHLGIIEAESGQVALLGNEVVVDGDAVIDVSGANGGGVVNVGGNFQGRGILQNSQYTYVGANTKILAEGEADGDGGQVILWSDNLTEFHGYIDVKATGLSSAGGFTEVSGKEILVFDGFVDTSALSGMVGTLLLDPINVEITDGALTGGYTSGITTAVLGGQLAVGNVIVTTSGGGGANGDILITDAVSYTGNNSLAFLAHGDITLNADVTLTGNGELSFVAGWDGATAYDRNAMILAPASSGNGGGIISSGARTLTTTGGDLFLAGAVNGGGGDLSLIAGAAGGDISLIDNLTNAATFAMTANTVTVKDVTTAGNQTYYVDTFNKGTLGGGGTLRLAPALSATAIGIGGGAGYNPDLALANASGFAIQVFGQVSGTHAFSIDAGGVALVIDTVLEGQTINLAGNVNAGANDLTLTNSGLVSGAGLITASNLTINGTGVVGATGAAAINTTIATAIFANTSNVFLDETNAIELQGALTGDLEITAGGNITQTVAVTVSGATEIQAGGNDVTLDNGGNSFGDLLIVGDDVSITESAGITDSAVWNIGGTLTLDSGADIVLDFGDHLIDAVVVTDSSNATLDVAGALDFGTSSISGNLSVIADGKITDSGILSITGAMTLDTTGFLNKGKVTLKGNSNIDMGASIIGGNFILDANAVTDSGAVQVAGTVDAQAAGTTVLFDEIGGRIIQPVADSAGNINIASTGVIDLGADTVTGNLTVVSSIAGQTFGASMGAEAIKFDNDQNTYGGVVTINTDYNAGAAAPGTSGITQSGDLDVSGNTSLIVEGAGNIILNRAGNDFASVIATGATVTLVDSNAIDLGATTATVAYNVTAGGAITDSGVISANGITTTLDAGANAITLDQLSDFGVFDVNGAVTTLEVVDTDDIDIAAVTTTSTLDITAGGAIIDSGTIVAGGATTISNAGNTVVLDELANNFTSVAATGTTITLVDVDGIDLGTTTATVAFNVTAGGDIIDSGVITANGITTTLDAGANAITLDEASDFGTLDVNGAVTTLAVTDTDNINIAAVTTTGTLDITAGGAITDSGTIVAGAATTITNAGNTVVLDEVANNFTSVAVTGSDVTFVDVDAFNLAASTITGDLTITAGGAITDSGSISVTGTADFDTTSFTIGNKADVYFHNDRDTDLGASLIGGDLTLDSRSTTDSGAIQVAGTIDASAALTVTLFDEFGAYLKDFIDSDGNRWVAKVGNVSLGAEVITGYLVVIASDTGVSFGSVLAGGDAIKIDSAGNNFVGAVTFNTAADDVVAATAASITQTGRWDVAGTTLLRAENNGTITLLEAANDFKSAVTINAGDTQIKDANSIDFDTSTLTGDFTVNTLSGSVSQSGAISVTGASDITATTTITLDNAGNDFNSITTSGTTTSIRDTDALSITSINTNNTTLTLRAGGAVTQTGVIDTNDLLLLGTVDYTLTQNNVIDGDVAADVKSVSLKSTSTYNINTVGATNGITTTTGNVVLDTTGVNITATKGITTATGDITISKAINLLADLTMTTGAGAGNIAFAGDVYGNQKLTLIADAGDIDFNSTVGAGTALSGLLISSAANLDFDNTVAVDDEGIDITAGTVDILNTVTTTNLGTLEITNSGLLNIAAAGDMTLDGAFTQNGAGTVSTGGDITTTNDAIAFATAVTLLADVSLNTGAVLGNIQFDANVLGDFKLTAAAGTGDIDFNSTVGATTALSGLVISSASNLDFDSTVAVDDEGIDITAGTVDILNTVTTTNAGTLEITNSGLLDIAAAGDMTLDGAFTQNGAGTVQTGGDIITTNDTVLWDTTAVTLTADVSLNTGAGIGNVQFDNNVLGNFKLTAAAGTGDIDFNSSVGAGTALSGLVISSAANLDFDNTVAVDDEGIDITAGTVDILNTVTTTNSGSVEITNSGLLDIATVADMTLDGAFLQNGAGVVETAGDITTTNDAISFATAVTLTDAGTVALSTGAGAGTIAFQDALNGKNDFAEDLTLTAGTGSIDFDGIVGGIKKLGDLLINSALDVTADAAVSANTITQSAGTGDTQFDGAVVLEEVGGMAVTTNTVTINNTVDTLAAGNGGTVTITNAGLLDIAAAGDMTLDGAFTQNGAGAVQTGGDITTTNDTILWDTTAVTLTADVSLNTGAGIGNVQFDNNVLGNFKLTGAAGTGDIDFNSTVGAGTALSGLVISSAANLDFNNTVAVDDEGIDITAGTVDILNTVTTTNSGSVEITNSGLLDIAAAGDMTLDGAFLQNGAGVVEIAGDITTTNDAISFATAVKLTDAGTVALSTGAGAGAITFQDILNGTNDFAEDLTLAAGTGSIDFDGIVGGVKKLGDLLINSALDVTADAAVSANTITQSAGTGDTQFDGAVVLEAVGGMDITTNTVTLNNTINTLASGNGGTVTITNAGLLDIDAAAVMTLDGAFTQDGAGVVQTASDITTTNDTISFATAVTLLADVSLDTGAVLGNIQFDGNVLGNFKLTAAAGTGDIDFNSTVGATTALSGLVISSAANLDFDNTVAVDDEGIDITAGTVDILNTVTTTNAGTLEITNSGQLTVAAAGDMTLDGAFTQNGAGAVSTSGDITTTNDTILWDTSAVTLTADVSLNTGAGIGNVQFDNNVLGNFKLTATAGTGDIDFNSTVGAGTALSGLVISSAANLDFDNTVAVDDEGIDITAGTVDILNTVTTTNAGTLEITNSGQLTIAVAGDMSLDGAFTQNGAGAVSTGGDITTTTDTILWDTTAVTLTADVSLNTGAGIGNVQFDNNVLGNFKLTAAAGTGDIDFNSTVGAGTALSGLVISSAANLDFDNTVAVDDEGIDITAGTVDILNTVTTTNAGTLEITNSGLLTIAAAGDMTLDGAFTQNGAGAVSTAGDIATTNDTILWDTTAVTLTADVSLNTGAGIGNVQFDNNVLGNFKLTAAAGTGDIDFNSTVGATTALSGLVISSAANLDFDNTVAVDDEGIDITAGTVDILNTVTTTNAGTLEITNSGQLTVAAAGDITLDGVFTQNGAGAVSTGGDITTTNDTILWDTTAVTLTADVSLNTGAGIGNVQFDNNVLGNFKLTAAAGTGDIDFNSTVGAGTALSGLVISSAANLDFDNTVAVDDEGIDITAGTVDILNTVTTTNAGAFEITNSGLLDIAAAGDMTLDGAFLQNGAGLVETAGDITTTNDAISFATAVKLTDAGTVALSTGAGVGTITFQDTLNGTTDFAEDLTLTAGVGSIDFDGIVGGVKKLGNLLINSALDVTADVAVSANTITQSAGTGDTQFDGAVVLEAVGGMAITTNTVTLNNTIDTLAAGNGGTVTITNAGLLNIAVAGDMTLDGAFLQNGAGTVSTGGDITTTNDAINFATAVTLLADVSLNTGAVLGNIQFDDNVLGNFKLTAAAGTGDIDFNSNVGAGTALSGLVISSTSNLDFDNTVAVDDEGIDITAGTVDILNTVTTTNAGTLEITNAGLLDIAAAGDMTLDGAFLQNGAGLVETAGDITTTNDAISFATAVKLTDAGTVALSTGAGAGTITFQDILNGTNDFAEHLTLTAGTGNIDFDGIVGGTKDLGDVLINSALNVTADAAVSANTIIQSAGTGVTQFDGSVVLEAVGGMAITTNTVTLNNTINTLAAGNGGTVTITNAGLLDIHADADMSLDGAFTQNGVGAVQTGGDITTTNDNISFLRAVTLDGAVALSSGVGVGTITFQNTLDGTVDFAQHLTLTAGTGSIDFDGAVGGTKDLGDVLINSALNVTADAALSATTITQSAGSGGTQFDGAVVLEAVGGMAITTDTVTINNTINTLASGNDGTVTITNAGLLNIAAAGDMTLDGAFLQNGAGTVSTGGDITTTNDAISFATAVTLLADVSLNTGAVLGNIQFDGNVLGNFKLTAAAGTADIDFNSTVGAGTALSGLVISSADNLDFDNTVAVDDEGIDITAGTVDILNTVTTTNAGTVEITNSGLLDIAVAGDMTLDGAFLQNGAGLVETAGDITTTNDAISFATAVKLTDAGTVALSTGAGAGAITFQDILNGTNDFAENLTLAAGTGNIDFDGIVGGVKKLGNLLINSALDVTADAAVSANTITQSAGTGDTQFDGAVVLEAVGGMAITTNTVTLNNTIDTLASGNGGTVTITNAGLFDIAAAADMTLDGAFLHNGAGLVETAGDITTTNDDVIWDTTAVQMTGDVSMDTGAGAGSIRFDSDVFGAQTLTMTGGTGDIDFESTIGAGTAVTKLLITSSANLDFEGTVSIGGSGLDVTSGTIDVNGAITTTGGDAKFITDIIDINNTITSVAQTVTVELATAGNSIDIGSATDVAASTLEISDTELDQITTDNVIIGDILAGNVTVSNSLSQNAKNVTIISNANVNINEAVSTSGLFKIEGTASDNVINIQKTDVGTGVTVNAGAGTDTINLGNTTDKIDNILGTLNINGEGNDDTLAIHDAAGVTSRTFTLSNTQVIVNSTINYSQIESIIINTGTDDDTLVFNDDGIPITTDGGTGDDTADFSAIGTDVIVNMGEFTAFENFIGGTGDDTFVFSDGATPGGIIDGGAGSDTLDYSAYTSDVMSNFVDGTSTGISSFSNVENGIGGSADDTFLTQFTSSIQSFSGGPHTTSGDTLYFYSLGAMTYANSNSFSGLGYQDVTYLQFENLFLDIPLYIESVFEATQAAMNDEFLKFIQDAGQAAQGESLGFEVDMDSEVSKTDLLDFKEIQGMLVMESHGDKFAYSESDDFVFPYDIISSSSSYDQGSSSDEEVNKGGIIQ